MTLHDKGPDGKNAIRARTKKNENLKRKPIKN